MLTTRSDQFGIELLVARDGTVARFAYPLAFVPALLGLTIFSLVGSPRGFRGDEGAGTSVGWEGAEAFVTGLAVLILTVLPLRLVLVPTEVPGITRLDLILGVEVMLLVVGATAVATYSMAHRPGV